MKNSITSSFLKKFHPALLRWYDKYQRNLPWRNTDDAYSIWVSEVMLQQTQVRTVIPYYIRFMDKFPTVQKLANAHQQTVLKMWEGLGYYSRARNLYRAAKIVVHDYEGLLPQDWKQTRPNITRLSWNWVLWFAHPTILIAITAQLKTSVMHTSLPQYYTSLKK